MSGLDRPGVSEAELGAVAALDHALGCRCGWCVDGRLLGRAAERMIERRQDDDHERRAWL